MKQHGIVGRTTDGFFRYQAWPTVAKAPNGTLYVLCSGHRLAHVCPFGKNYLYMSENNGEKWLGPLVVNDGFMDNRDGGIAIHSDGTMVISWFDIGEETFGRRKWRNADLESPLSLGMRNRWETLSEEEKKVGAFCKVSHDGGYTWSEKRRTPVSAPHGPIFRQDGSLFYVGFVRDRDGIFPYGSMQVFESRNEGVTWEHLSTLPTPSHFKGEEVEQVCEPHAVCLPNGEILAGMRVHSGPVRDKMKIALTRSADGGKSWSEPTFLDLFGSPPHFTLTRDGVVILSYGKRIEPFGEYAVYSKDNGHSWSKEILLRSAPDWDLGYPATVETHAGDLITVYYQKYEQDCYNSILSTRWRLEEEA